MHRRTFLLTSLLPALLASVAEATEIDPKQTFVLQRDDIGFAPWAGLPPGSGEMAKLYGDIDQPGPYLVLMKWNPGWFSAPHSYATDRIQMVMSGTWWVNSGADFTPELAIARPADQPGERYLRGRDAALLGDSLGLGREARPNWQAGACPREAYGHGDICRTEDHQRAGSRSGCRAPGQSRLAQVRIRPRAPAA